MAIQVHRREFIFALGGAATAWSRKARAQGKHRVPKVGVLWHAGSAEEEGPLVPTLVEGFKKLGYVDGQTIVLEHRFPNEVPERFRSMAAELVALNVDVLMSSGTTAALYAKAATATIPVVAMLVSDPIGIKLVDSLARPGGNVTGLSAFHSELIGKRLQLLKEAMPSLSRVAQLVNPLAQVSRLFVDLTQTAADQLGVKVERFEAGNRGELEPAFSAMARADMQGGPYQPRWTGLYPTRAHRPIGAQKPSGGGGLYARGLSTGNAFVVRSRRLGNLSPGGRVR